MWRSTFSTAAGSISGPTSTSSSSPSPTFISSMRSTRRRENSPPISRCTNMRLAETQVWPALRILVGDHVLDGVFQVRVLEDDEGRVAAELERELFDSVGRSPH